MRRRLKMSKAGKVTALLLVLPVRCWAAAGAAPAGDPVRGKELYQICTACHTLDQNDLGPRHRGVVGRHAGSVPGYDYSPALKSSNLTWNAATLDRWLTNPSALVPGTKM